MPVGRKSSHHTRHAFEFKFSGVGREGAGSPPPSPGMPGPVSLTPGSTGPSLDAVGVSFGKISGWDAGAPAPAPTFWETLHHRDLVDHSPASTALSTRWVPRRRRSCARPPTGFPATSSARRARSQWPLRRDCVGTFSTATTRLRGHFFDRRVMRRRPQDDARPEPCRSDRQENNHREDTATAPKTTSAP